MREKTSWIAVLTTLVIWSYYFSVFWINALNGRIDGVELRTLFIICMGLSVVIMLSLTIAVAVMARQSLDAAPDERERQIEARADSIGFKLLEVLVPIVLIGGLLNLDVIRGAFPADPVGSTAILFANGFLMTMVVTELVRESVKIVLFRMAA
ncbi:hypothetical protein [Devosia beringensis]|uniref:hypothetical protein n=1 Tax=Devosia beringensis TaxID=2657486 RepID=UPI00186BB0A2|nr:hypothetical protein [Devosia beringensis]